MNNRTNIVTIGLLAAGAFLRAAGLLVSPIWYDESYSIWLSRVPAKMVLLEYLDFNPPLWQLLAYPFIRALGESELALRLPALLASLAAMRLAWALAEEMGITRAKWPALGAAALIGLLPYHFWVAQDGRPYAVMSCLYMLLLLLAWRGRWVGFGAAVGLLLYTHSTGLFYAAAAGLGALVLHWPERKKIILAGALGGLTFLPWVPALLGKEGHWIGQLTIEGLVSSLYFASFTHLFNMYWGALASLVLVASLVAALVVAVYRWRDRRHLSLTCWAIGPLLLMLAASPIKNIIFYRPLSAMLLPLGIWLAASLLPIEQPRGWHWLTAYVWAVLLVASLLAWNPGTRGGQLRDVAATINDQWQPGDVIYHATATTYLPLDIYTEHHPAWLLDENQHAGLLQTSIQEKLGIPRAGLEDIPHRRAWVVWAKDILVSDRATARMKEYTTGGLLVGHIDYWQAARVDVYLVQQ